MANRLIIVTGQMRSGTSLCASMLHMLGAPVARTMLAPTWPLRRCDWEDTELSLKMHEIASALVLNRPILGDWWSRWYDEYLCCRLDLAPLVITDKSPMFMALMPQVRKVCEDLGIELRVICCVRDPAKQAKSIDAAFHDPGWACKVNAKLQKCWDAWAPMRNPPMPIAVIDTDQAQADPERAARILEDVVGEHHPPRFEAAVNLVERSD